MRVTLRAAKRTSTIQYVGDLFANKLDEVLTLIEIGLREKGKDMAGMVFVPAFFLCLKLP